MYGECMVCVVNVGGIYGACVVNVCSVHGDSIVSEVGAW